MDLFLNILILLGTTIFMECFAWFTHKYIMHGPMWFWHKSHHVPHDHALERNDLFVLLFSIPAVLGFVIGTQVPGWEFMSYVGAGVILYGILYFVFHDVIVHHRIKIPFKPQNEYLKSIMRAHYIHHRTKGREGAEAFGFLYASAKYRLKKKAKATNETQVS